MSTDKNNDIVRKRQEGTDAKQNEIIELLDIISKQNESKKEPNAIGDSEKE